MNCNEVRPLLSALFDGELEPPPALRAHVDACPECKEALEQYARARALIAAAGSVSAPGPLWPRIAEAVALQRTVSPWRARHLAAALVGALLYFGAFHALDSNLQDAPDYSPAGAEDARQAAVLLGDLHRRLATGEIGGGEQGLEAAAELRLMRQILESKESGR